MTQMTEAQTEAWKAYADAQVKLHDAITALHTKETPANQAAAEAAGAEFEKAIRGMRRANRAAGR